MAFAVPEGLAPEVYPLAWLVGRWRGPGYLGYPGIPERPILVETELTSDGGPYLAYSQTVLLLDGEPVAPDAPIDQQALRGEEVWSTESGYWRVPPAAPGETPESQAAPSGTSPVPLEVLLSDPAGYVSLYLGAVAGPRIDLATDLVARTQTGADVTAATRMYGLVDGDLMWAIDMAAFGQEMTSYASGRLQRLG